VHGLRLAVAITVLSSLASVALAIFINLGTGGTAPSWLSWIQGLAWPIVGFCAILTVALTAFSAWLDHRKSALYSKEVALSTRPEGITLHRYLPPLAHAFSGRKKESTVLINKLCGQRQKSDLPPKLAIAGKPGVGKSTLALNVAYEVTDCFPGAQLFIDLGGMKANPLSPAAAATRLLTQLGEPAESIPIEQQSILRLLQSKIIGLKVLIVLDDAGSEEQVKPILDTTAESAVILTSRRPLVGLAEVELMMLECLNERESIELLQSIVGDRIRHEVESAKEIARLCGYLPLALRIIAARLNSRPELGVQTLAAELADEARRLDAFKAGDLEVKSSFNLSYRELTAQQKQVFRRASVIPGISFDARVVAAAAELPAEVAKQALEELVDFQLIDVDSRGRFKYHDLLRLFAREQLEETEGRTAPVAAVRRSVTSYVEQLFDIAYVVDPEEIVVYGNQLDSTREASVDAQSMTEQSALEWLITEKDNVISSAYIAQQMELDELLVQLGAAIRPFGLSGFPLRELVEIEQAAVDSARRLGDKAMLARVLFNLGRSFRHHGMATVALTHLKESFGLADSTGSRAFKANVLYFIGHAQRESGRLEEARQSYEQAGRMFAALAWEAKAAAVVANLGLVEDNQGNLKAAERLLRDAARRFQETTLSSVLDRRERAWTTQSLGGVLMRRGEFSEAQQKIEEALQLFRELQDRQGQVYSIRDLGDLNSKKGNLQLASSLYAEALEISTELGEERGRAQALASISILAARRGQFARSVQAMRDYSSTFLRLHDQGRSSSILALIGWVILASVGVKISPRFPRAR
jgi:tetratricopeptide (TPR) repeat protein